MTSQADRMIEALRSGHQQLVELVNGVTPEDLTRISGASEWTVAQVLSHLGSGAEITLAGLENALAGKGATEREFATSVWARWDGMSPAEQAAEFPGADEKLLARYESLDSATRESLRIDLGFLPTPVDLTYAAGLRLNEVALHSWDARVTFDPAATLAPEATAELFELVGALLRFGGKADQLDGSTRIAVHTTDPRRDFGLEIADAVTLGEVPAEPDATLTAPAEYWLRLATGRHAPDHTPGSVSVTGSVSLDDLRKVFPGF
ncbi:MAG TPA: maleylpyruvate isomerase family mycothiol-dependent enzyme [Pseudonocardiaceae bacterium]|jgi:uncharacterized protein (TIGR03083 family)|nr:maleylpyruvate isomerase family mycothiol-dependent enzyme [Pseudonocardiaceae bacterium]